MSLIFGPDIISFLFMQGKWNASKIKFVPTKKIIIWITVVPSTDYIKQIVTTNNAGLLKWKLIYNLLPCSKIKSLLFIQFWKAFQLYTVL